MRGLAVAAATASVGAVAVAAAGPPARPAGLAPVADGVVESCAKLGAARDVPVLCPTRLPGAGWAVSNQTLRRGRCEYLFEAIARDPRADPYHLLAGGRCGRFPLRASRGRWPADATLPRDLGLVGVASLRPGQRVAKRVRLRVRRRAHVDGHPALLVAVAPFPGGGVHGDHLGVVWNQDGAGYALTLHPAEGEPVHRGRESALLRAARAMSRFAG